MSELSLAEIATEPKSVEEIGEVDTDFSRDFSTRRGCLACGIPLHTGFFCSQTHMDKYTEWVKQKEEYIGLGNLPPLEKFLLRYEGAYFPLSQAKATAVA